MPTCLGASGPSLSPLGPPYLIMGTLGSFTLSVSGHHEATLGQLCWEDRMGPRSPCPHPQCHCKVSRAELSAFQEPLHVLDKDPK